MVWYLLLFALDVILAFFLTARLTLLIIGDELGRRWVREPVMRRLTTVPFPSRRHTLWGYVHGLVGCPFCIGFWIGVGVLVSLWLAGGPGSGTSDVWRWVAAPFALNYLAGHLAVRLGDKD